MNQEIMANVQTYKANGKLLLSGEYVVLDGAMALAVPTRLGQTMIVEKSGHSSFFWKSVDVEDNTWFEGEFNLDGKYINGSEEKVGKTLEQMFLYILSVHPDFLKDKAGTSITTHLEFDRTWGLGSSSTLVYNLAQWAEVNSHQLLRNTLGGSGYDVACAGASASIFYQIQEGQPISRASRFSPSFKDNIYFIHLGQKQDSKEGVLYYRQNVVNNPRVISNISIISHRMINATTASEFEALISHHEQVLSKILNIPTVKSQRFPDFWGEIKSLGAWGGDFVMAVSQHSPQETISYFKEKGCPVIFRYDEMVLG